MSWGTYWQVTYTTYSPETKVKSLQWPLSDAERQEVERTCQAWLKAESTPPEPPQSPADR